MKCVAVARSVVVLSLVVVSLAACSVAVGVRPVECGVSASVTVCSAPAPKGFQ